MNPMRKSGVLVPQVAGSACVGLLLLGMTGAAGCGDPYDTVTVLALDCSIEEPFEFESIEKFETEGAASFWTSADTTVGSMTVAVEAMNDGERCGSKDALVVRASHNNDWGSLAGYNNFGPRDASEYEGLSFWARAPGNTTKAFTVLLDDENTFSTAGRCTDYGGSGQGDSSGGGGGGASASDPGTNSSSNGRASFPDECGNSYATAVVVSDQWELYTIPFSKFTQTAQPNRVPNAVFTETGGIPGTGIIPGKLWNLVLRMPKEATMELWIDNLGFYRKAGANAEDSGDAQE